MAIKKIKISALKRAHHLRNKKKIFPKQRQNNSKSLDKQFKHDIKKSSKIKYSQKSIKNQSSSNVNNEIDEEIMDSIKDMIENDDLIELKENNRRGKKRNIESLNENDAIHLETEYTEEALKIESRKKRIKSLLPIKNKEGEIITRTANCKYTPKPKVETVEKDNVDEVSSNCVDSDDDIIQDNKNNENLSDQKMVISTADLLIRREQEVQRQKYKIGIICSGILEKPEDKMKNFSVLFDMIDEYNENQEANLLSIRKTVLLSIAEIFKDILPEYRVGQVDTKMTTVRKTTLQRVTYENDLLQQFKKYLHKLEKLVSTVSKKPRKISGPDLKMAETAVKCLCSLLSSHPYFNYGQNIAQLLVYLSNSFISSIREMVNQCFREIFANDIRLDMTLYIVRRINNLVKSKSNNVHLEVMTSLLSLRIKKINLNAEKEKELKQKKLEAHKQRVMNLSKRERKRKKRLNELNKELEETRAEENRQQKHRKLTEITKMVFTIYFRILKNEPNSKLLSACLQGLAEFAHVINLELFSDLIEVLNNLLDEGNLEYRQQLHCIKTIFIILSGQGEALNIDPMRFYGYLYKNLLDVNAGKTHEDFKIILQILNDVMIKRRKNITQQRLLAFVKRLMTLALNLLDNSCLSSLGVVKTLMQLTSSLEIIIDTDTSIGSGRFDPELDDPEYCNANCTALYELATLQRHYHPIVKKFAYHIACGVPSNGDGCLPVEIGKLTSEELFDQYDSSKIAFNPAIPVPKDCKPKLPKGKHNFIDSSLEEFCLSITKTENRNVTLDFYNILKKD